MDFFNDPIGFAINSFIESGEAGNITVKSDLCEDDIMPVEYFFRPLELMPELEQIALKKCHGKVLDVGAAAGCHSIELQENGIDVTAIDTSLGCVNYLTSIGINAKHLNFYKNTLKYDTLLILMNGVGIAQTLSNLPLFLKQIKNSLNPGGSAICDSTDLTYLYQEDDGSMWVDLNGAYYGEMKFQMSYKNIAGDWFNWLYIDFDLLSQYCQDQNLSCEKIYQGENNQYLVEIKIIE
jgi:SAM-dependent methyltransferase